MTLASRPKRRPRLLMDGSLPPGRLPLQGSTGGGGGPAPGVPDIPDLLDLTWENQSDADADQPGGAGTAIDYETGTVYATKRGLYAAVDGSSPVEVQVSGWPDNLTDVNASSGAYLRDSTGAVLVMKLARTSAVASAGVDLNTQGTLASTGRTRTEFDRSKVYRGAYFEDASFKYAERPDGAWVGVARRAIDTQMLEPTGGGYTNDPANSGTGTAVDVSRLRIGAPEVHEAINGNVNLKDMTYVGGGSGLYYPTQDQVTGALSVYSLTGGVNNPFLYLATEGAAGELVMSVDTSPNTPYAPGLAVFDLVANKQRTWGPQIGVNNVLLVDYAGFSYSSTPLTVAHTWNVTTSRVRILITVTEILYQISSDSGATWSTEFTETRGSAYAEAHAVGHGNYFVGHSTGDEFVFPEFTWTPS